MAYRLLFDYHTHTTYSHGKGSIMENAEVAAARGLTALAITDHGPGSIFFGLKAGDLPRMRAEIREAMARFPGLKILLGTEANILVPTGRLDVPPAMEEEMDLVMAGYHCGALGPDPISAAVTHLKNLSGLRSRKMEESNTALLLRAIKRGGFRILTHPGDKGRFNIGALARACEEQNILMEVNNGHGHMNVEELKEAARTGVGFIIGSDAHEPKNVGCFERALDIIFKAGVDPARVVNLAEI